jgi:hypothetical protein
MSDGRILKLDIVFSNKTKLKPKTLVKTQQKPVVQTNFPSQTAVKPHNPKQDDNLLFKLLFACQEI